MVAERVQNRRAVIVLTDGLDNASGYTPEQVAWIASTIDVPIYVFDVGDRPVERDARKQPSPREALAGLARATGGDLFVAKTPVLVAQAVRRVAEELRSQYLIAFEGASDAGMRRVEVRMRKPDLKVQSRSWYQVADE
jgi:VWFA-related protein